MAPASSSSPGHIGHNAPIDHNRLERHIAISSMKLYTHVHMFGEIRIKAEDGAPIQNGGPRFVRNLSLGTDRAIELVKVINFTRMQQHPFNGLVSYNIVS